jgi:signal transduction histidine kinase
MKLRTPILLLAIAVVLPTACVLWLMNAAVHNLRLGVRQNLSDLYADHMALARERLNAGWQENAAALERLPEGAAALPEIVRTGLTDSAVILDASGAPLYPAPVQLPMPDPTVADPQWIKARQLEATTPAAAVAVYEAIGSSGGDAAARAYQAAARCLMQSGDKEAAIRLVLDRFSGADLATATDLQGRRIRADALLMAITFLKPGDPRLLPAARKLRAALLDYSQPAMSSAQRVFLIRQIQSMKLPPDLLAFPALEAEELAARFLEAEPRPAGDIPAQSASRFAGDGSLRLSLLPDVWQISARNGRVVALLRTSTVQAQMRKILGTQNLPKGIQIEALLPGRSPEKAADTVLTTAGAQLPGWSLVLTHSGPDPLADLASRQMTLYLWTGSLVIFVVAIVAFLAARVITRSLRLAGMKADLVTTVSHELKTPLASMQLLVDTLLDDPELDPVKTREYLEMMARENARLSQLIGNFLAFSRMERNKYAFDFTALRVDDVVRAAIAAAGERFSEPGCRLTVEVEPNLPEIRADEGALVTALVNLLDNAYKYTPGEKRIELRAHAQRIGRRTAPGWRQEHGVCFEVRDNGIGIAPREIKKIFRKFYQADRRLARTGGGCGLGLPIVRYLVEAHGGRVAVTSEIGKGSTFTVAVRTA